MSRWIDSSRGWLVTAVLALSVPCSLDAARYTERNTYTVTIERKEIKNGTYMLFGELQPSGEKKAFVNRDNWTGCKFDSSDIYAKVDEGKTYRLDTIGWRSNFPTMYENVVGITPVDNN